MHDTGLVVARFRRHVAVENADGEQILCLTRGRALKPLVGDTVAWRSEADGTPVVCALTPRRTTLTRIDSRGKCEPIAADVSQLVIVAAAEPPPDWFLVDRYLVAAELLPARALIVINKNDLLREELAPLQIYRRIGYATLLTSAKQRAGLIELGTAMAGERSVLVGQSGVGKSSLGNALLGEQAQAVGELTGKGKHGRHTTSTASLFRLAGGAELIDSPGVRSYAPYIADPRDVARGFREFRAYLGECRFDDCAHDAEPGCAVKDAVDAGAIDAQRYESYTRLRAMLESLPPA